MYESHHHVLAATSKQHPVQVVPSNTDMQTSLGHSARRPPFLTWFKETYQREKAAKQYSKWEQHQAYKIQQYVKEQFGDVDKLHGTKNVVGKSSLYLPE
eukprot:550291-Rhodomonas_salina.1